MKCSVAFSLSTEPHLQEEDDATTYIATNEYGDSNYCPTIDATYEELTEEEESPVDGTGGTLVEPKRRPTRSIYDKLMAIYPLERQPIPVAPRCTETCIESAQERSKVRFFRQVESELWVTIHKHYIMSKIWVVEGAETTPFGLRELQYLCRELTWDSVPNASYKRMFFCCASV